MRRQCLAHRFLRFVVNVIDSEFCKERLFDRSPFLRVVLRDEISDLILLHPLTFEKVERRSMVWKPARFFDERRLAAFLDQPIEGAEYPFEVERVEPLYKAGQYVPKFALSFSPCR